MAKESKDEALSLVKEFLTLNQKLRKEPAKPAEMRQWYQLKSKIEEALFASPPVPKDPRRSVRIGGLKQRVSLEGDFEGQEGTIKEASERGLFLAMSDPLPVGTELALTFNDIHVRARVVYS